jgi:quercetin 2,3-dioxygenase
MFSRLTLGYRGSGGYDGIRMEKLGFDPHRGGMQKPIVGIYASPQGHWVGDGFPVRSLFSYDRLGQHISPFLLLDYAGPQRFAPTDRPRGVGEHPHRGFETVTIVYQGEVAHRDSTGKGGVIGPGDVQWMTAAGGILHQEFHSEEFTRRGGELEMVQLWVNLPAEHKMSPPRYQTLLNGEIPRISLQSGAGSVRVIAGHYAGENGPASTFSSLNVWDVRLTGRRSAEFELPGGHIAAIAVLKGAVTVNGSDTVKGVGLLVLGKEGVTIALEAAEDSQLLLLSGAPILEPIVGYGPFVMNSREEIQAAIDDLRAGKFGRISPSTAETSTVS